MTRRAVCVAAALLAALLLVLPAQASAGKGKHQVLTVCKHGCKYRSIQKAVNRSGKKATIRVKPGKYVEGVIVSGKRHDKLTIKGTSKNPRKVILEGKGAKSPTGPAQNGIEGVDVKGLRIMNMTARNFLTNGFFVHDGDTSDGKTRCRDYVMKNLYTSFNRAYGLYAFGCGGGKMLNSTGVGHGDSAFYVGATPPLKKPEWTTLSGLDGHENVQGYTGQNSRWVEIKNSDFYNNGLGVIPNTGDSEPFEPTTTGKIHDNNIFWNNYNYYLPTSKVKTISNGLGQIGDTTINFPIGVGLIAFGVTDMKVYDNNIFGNYKWGVSMFSDPLTNDGNDAIAFRNRFINNTMGRGGGDPNGVDFFADGSGSGNCFEGNSTSTFDPSATATNDELYPTCPAPPTSGSGTQVGDGEQQFDDLVGYVLSDPPETQECDWTKTPHPKYRKYRPVEVKPGPICPVALR